MPCGRGGNLQLCAAAPIGTATAQPHGGSAHDTYVSTAISAGLTVTLGAPRPVPVASGPDVIVPLGALTECFAVGACGNRKPLDGKLGCNVGKLPDACDELDFELDVELEADDEIEDEAEDKAEDRAEDEVNDVCWLRDLENVHEVVELREVTLCA